jgi:hypothetical protein
LSQEQLGFIAGEIGLTELRSRLLPTNCLRKTSAKLNSTIFENDIVHTIDPSDDRVRELRVEVDDSAVRSMIVVAD